MPDRLTEREHTAVRQVLGEVAQLRTLVYVLAAIVLVLVVAVVVLFIL